MNNLERFKKAIEWEPVDRILTYDYLDTSVRKRIPAESQEISDLGRQL